VYRQGFSGGNGADRGWIACEMVKAVVERTGCAITEHDGVTMLSIYDSRHASKAAFTRESELGQLPLGHSGNVLD
jgi:hypothetical protein